ncbi:hypothetical protein OU997_17895 [Pseudomonas sp. SL4(2022)]|uniref:hypothetical protein n=1 Tax=Pseudomonas sp. SL4(2022) TaxID=2994661 RepID=UPI00226F09AA|nr:hypothetical protein [Pseudomonas sp. SL4(2022)]WAC44090.1 hypothetical protein OU997_17895 [Pseudomonas sp. SL4(2022)]
MLLFALLFQQFGGLLAVIDSTFDKVVIQFQRATTAAQLIQRALGTLAIASDLHKGIVHAVFSLITAAE